MSRSPARDQCRRRRPPPPTRRVAGAMDAPRPNDRADPLDPTPEPMLEPVSESVAGATAPDTGSGSRFEPAVESVAGATAPDTGSARSGSGLGSGSALRSRAGDRS